MPDLEFLPAWYPRLLRRRRLVAVLATVAAVLACLVALAVSLGIYSY